MTGPLIEVAEATFQYGSATSLGPFTVEFRAGEVTFIVGPNGAGKTTLLRMLAGLAQPMNGTVRAFGLDPASAARLSIARRIAFLPQKCDFTFPFTVSEIVLLGRYAHGRRGLAGFFTAAADRQRAAEAMAACDITELAERPWNQLSGGEQRRTLLAQAFCQDAEVLLLDEPTASLDPAHAIEVFETVNRHLAESADRAAIVVSHDLNLAARFGDRVVLVNDGLVISDGVPREVIASDEAAAAFGISLHIGSLPNSDIAFVVPR